ncbi:MAG: hypothetical protein M3Y56_13115 [Armatimonadota bacterium]|nr:hypothetical protein [Armatimonadota bacterium]
MSYAPDYGLMIQATAGSDTTFTFHSFKVYHICAVRPEEFTTLVEIPFDGQRYAASFDFNNETLLEITRLCSDVDTITAIANWYDALTGPNTLELPQPIEIGVEATLGKLQSNNEEQYVPLTIERVFKVEAEDFG